MDAPADITWRGYSLAERDWRRQRVRDKAAKAGFDCVFVPTLRGRQKPAPLTGAVARDESRLSLSHELENGAVVLPTDVGSPSA